jgi:ubiquinone biosynthesis protein COQ9
MTQDSTYDRDADRLALLDATLSHAAFDGWSQKAFEAGARMPAFRPTARSTPFPAALSELLAFYHETEDREMLEAMARANVSRCASATASPSR